MKKMTGKQLKETFLKYFESKGHAIIESSSLIPEHDPTVLFTTAGMHPLTPYLLSQPHPLGKRLADVQKCLRTDDIDEVGDNFHHTFFEMLGNWSLGDYFKEEAISFSFEFLTKVLGMPVEKLAVSCFAGDEHVKRDDESANIWERLGIPKKRIAFLDRKNNWWGPAGETGPCGPDTEMFYWSSDEPAPERFDPNDDRWVEIWNDVFMEYNKTKEGKFIPLKQKNVDTGLGVERVTAILQGYNDDYKTELFWPIIQEIEAITNKKYETHTKLMRIIADHSRAIVFILGDEHDVIPSNVDQGYILRRLIRRVIRTFRQMNVGIENNSLIPLAVKIIEMYKDEYPLLEKKKKFIIDEIKNEELRFKRTLDNGLKEFNRIISNLKPNDKMSGKDAFLLFQSYGFPIEITQELAKEKGLDVDIEEFNNEYKKHQEKSRKGAVKRFKGGLSDASEQTIKLHTATHILNEALRRVLSKDIRQKGSNITPERLRFDFNFSRKLTKDEIKKVEDEVNRVIKKGLEVKRVEMSLDEALKTGAQAEFGAKYPNRVSVYFIGDYSKEICMGPHVKNTKELGTFKIIKEESSAAGIRRIKAVLI